MSNADHLFFFGNGANLPTDDIGNASTDAGVYFVKHIGRNLVGPRQDPFQKERWARLWCANRGCELRTCEQSKQRQ